jgi:hypothetical protein
MASPRNDTRSARGSAKPGIAEKRPLGIACIVRIESGRLSRCARLLGYRFKRTRRGRLMKLVRPKSLRKLRESIKPRTKRSSGRSMEAMVAEMNRKLRGWYGYFKHADPSDLEDMDQWLRTRLRSILRKRRGGRGRGRGRDHQRWPNRYFAGIPPSPPTSPRLRRSGRLR